MHRSTDRLQVRLPQIHDDSLAFAGRVAKGVIADLIPAERRPLVIGIALVLYTSVVVLLTRACSG